MITLVFGLPIVVAVPLSFMGFIRGIKGILKQEPSNRKMFIGIVGNLVLIGLFTHLIISNIMDTQVIQ